tara:strand:- start:188 stop:1111 length:924 start_codon:yes stop_codon:yes gene_type:complete
MKDKSILRVDYDEVDMEHYTKTDIMCYKSTGEPITGIVCFDKHNRKMEETLKNGIRHGVFRDWWSKNLNPNNQLKCENNWKEGKLHGEYKEWDSNGQLIKKQNWENGIEEGVWEIYNKGIISDLRKYEKGKLIEEYNIDEKGNKITKTENKVKVIVYSGENISLGGEVEILISEESLISYLEEDDKEYEDFDGYFGTCSIGNVEEMIKEDGKIECIVIERCIIFYHEKEVYVERLELKTINTPQGNYEELNNVYHKIGNGENYKLMSKEELEYYKKTSYYEDHTEYGWDVQTVEDFDLEVELTRGYF